VSPKALEEEDVLEEPAAVVVGPRGSDLSELSLLTKAAGWRVVDRVVAPPAADPRERSRTLVDSLAIAELRSIADAYEDVTVVFDDELTPEQQGSLERALRVRAAEQPKSKKQRAMLRQAQELSPDFDKFAEKKRGRRRRRGADDDDDDDDTKTAERHVADRTAVVLELFARRAKTGEGRLQTALATTLYKEPRASMRRGLGADQQMGSTKTERKATALADQKTLRQRARSLRGKIRHLARHRDRTRRKRRTSGVPVVALVGYTNAGKSSLFEALLLADQEDPRGDEEDGASIDDQPFATLDPLTRRFAVDKKSTALLTDTVGFVAKLPASVSAAFRATLEEVKAADVLVHVLDASDSQLKKRAEIVDAELGAIFQDEPPPARVLFYNKIDKLDPAKANGLRRSADHLNAKAKAGDDGDNDEEKEGEEQQHTGVATSLGGGKKTTTTAAAAARGRLLRDGGRHRGPPGRRGGRPL